jgi:hypothetical protein
MNVQKLIAASLISLTFSLGAAQAALITSGTVVLDSSDPTQSGRILRDGTPSVWGAAKPFPGALTVTGQYAYEVISFNTGIYDQISWSNEYVSGGIAHSVVYSFFNPANLGSGYLGDTGSSSVNAAVTVNGQIDVTPGQNLFLVFSSTNQNLPASYNYRIEGFQRAAQVPVPTSLALLVFGIGLLARKRSR